MKRLWQRLLSLCNKLLCLCNKMATEEYDCISFCFLTETEEGHGEDAPPLLITKGNSCAVGVFDGMGGAGARICETSSVGEGHTQAYVSSRIVCSSVDTFLQEHLPIGKVSVVDMKEIIKRRLHEEKEAFSPKVTSSLRSKLVREYPTTMAVLSLQEDDKSYRVDSYWAGDSHCYLWTKDGFFQISRDDLENNSDPMENLNNDSPISNCICADRDFMIHHKTTELKKEPVVIFCASDGCFGYYQTPMHFEYILKSSLQTAKNEQEWELLIRNEVLKVTGDDCSLSLVAKGFSSFEEMKRTIGLTSEEIKEVIARERDVLVAEQILADAKKEYKQKIISNWSSYKKNYMKYINQEDDGNA